MEIFPNPVYRLSDRHEAPRMLRRLNLRTPAAQLGAAPWFFQEGAKKPGKRTRQSIVPTRNP
jgi:hypothetical protein